MTHKLSYAALAAVVAVGLVGCSKKQGNFESRFFTTVPTPVESVGQNVPATVNGSLPAKFIQKNAKVTATPVLQWTDGEAVGQPVIIQGENVRANGQMVSYKEGGQVVIPYNAAYQPGMEKSELFLDFNVDQNGKLYTLPRVRVGYGVVSTSTLASAATVVPAIAPDNFQKVIKEKYSADIHFLINQANVRTSQTAKADYIDLNKKLIEASQASNKEIAELTVNSYASPEGSYEFNEKLAQKREQNTAAYLENQLKKDKITEFGELTSSFTPEDWEGFQELVAKSNIQDKELILGVLKMYKDPVQREQEIRNLSSVFNELADQILPQLRYSRVMATINVIGKSDQEMLDLYSSEPSKLTADELLYVATLTDDNARKMAVYKKAVEIYPNDYRSYNNLGMTEYAAGNYATASALFKKAQQMNPQSKEAAMNLGLIDLLEGRYAQANEKIGLAAGIPEAADALGVYYLTQGETSKAINAFGEAKTNNAALAQILTKDYASARTTLAGITNPDATTFYLTAILGARQGNENMVMSNLRQAVRLDSKLLDRAKNDLEFASYNLSYL